MVGDSATSEPCGYLTLMHFPYPDAHSLISFWLGQETMLCVTKTDHFLTLLLGLSLSLYRLEQCFTNFIILRNTKGIKKINYGTPVFARFCPSVLLSIKCGWMHGLKSKMSITVWLIRGITSKMMATRKSVFRLYINNQWFMVFITEVMKLAVSLTKLLCAVGTFFELENVKATFPY